ncbi:MAG: glycosyltransferase family protein [Candidatus Omnitrophica bacterium]|nr:glycosyltransferase family protein [Candidatus Omnitrophota bacterium]
MDKADTEKVVAVVQARMGSTRLPGKALMDIEGHPMLWHVVNRLGYCGSIDNIVVATSSDKKDDDIERFCVGHGIDFYRGSEEDVLDRYYRASIVSRADVVVRITADCPLIDPQVSDKVISGYLKNESVFEAASNTLKRTYPRGLDTEVFSFSALERAWKEARKDYEREHVTAYIYEHPDRLKVYSVENDSDLSHLRWTVDEGPDLTFVREIYKRLYTRGQVFLMQDVLGILREEPALADVNKHVAQKAVRE